MKKNIFKMGVASVGLLGAMTLSAVAANNVHVYADEEKPVAVQPTAKQEAEKMVTKAELGVTVEKAKENIAKLKDFKADLEKQAAEGVKLLATEEGTPDEKKVLSTALDDLHKKAADVDKKIAELEGKIADATAKIADLDALLQKDPAATDVDLTRANYKAARAQVEKDIEDLNARLAELKKEKESTPPSDELDLKIAAVEAEIRDKQAEIDDINKMILEIGDSEESETTTPEMSSEYLLAPENTVPEYPTTEVPATENPEGEAPAPAMEEEKDPEAESDAEMLPYTGVADGFVVFGAATAILTGLGIAIPGKKKQ